MNTAEYLAALRVKYPAARSTYAMAKLLEVSYTAAGRYDHGENTFDDAVAVRVAGLLGIHPGIVTLDMHRERAKTSEARRLWDEIQEGFRVPLPRADRMGTALTR